jgi:hypothetical protein
MHKKIVQFFVIFLFLGTIVFFPIRVFAADTVDIKPENNWVQDLFGGGNLKLSIFAPTSFAGGKASIWSFIFIASDIAFPLLFISFVVMVAIGLLKWFSANGNETVIQSAQKTIKNAATGFAVMSILFVVANVIVWWLGFKNIYDLPKNFSTCKGVALYEFKRKNSVYLDSTNCSCDGIDWRCT